MADLATIADINNFYRQLKPEEEVRASALISSVSAIIEQEFIKAGKQREIDEIDKNSIFREVVKSVVVDVVARALMTSTTSEPMTQISQSAGGYSTSGTFLVPGGGIFVKKSEWARLGLHRQKVGVIDFYGHGHD